MQLLESSEHKIVRSPSYNYFFDKKTGYFARWGKTKDDDPLYAPSPEILDLEISVQGCPNHCAWCYKDNTNGPATNMSFETFKTILDKIPKSLTQIAFGITGVQTNPDFLKMMQYSREQGIIPNFTLSGIDLTDKLAKQIAKVAGALAVSVYQPNPDIGYNTVKKFTDLGMEQVNIHAMTCLETESFIYEIIRAQLEDPRLAKMNAIVFLGMKPKGRAAGHFHPLPQDKYAKLIKHCLDKEIPFGFDSCSSQHFEHLVPTLDISDERKTQLLQVAESCESSLFSSYINVHGQFSPCSFTENTPGWEDGGISVLDAEDFIKEVWNHPRTVIWRLNLLNNHTNCKGCRSCPTFPEINL